MSDDRIGDGDAKAAMIEAANLLDAASLALRARGGDAEADEFATGALAFRRLSFVSTAIAVEDCLLEAYLIAGDKHERPDCMAWGLTGCTCWVARAEGLLRARLLREEP